jgi:hypothetical protein
LRTLAVWCLGRDCHHNGVIDVSRYGDDVPVPSFGTRLRIVILLRRPRWHNRQF